MVIYYHVLRPVYMYVLHFYTPRSITMRPQECFSSMNSQDHLCIFGLSSTEISFCGPGPHMQNVQSSYISVFLTGEDSCFCQSWQSPRVFALQPKKAHINIYARAFEFSPWRSGEKKKKSQVTVLFYPPLNQKQVFLLHKTVICCSLIEKHNDDRLVF